MNRHRVLAVIAYLGYERNAEAERLGRLHKHPPDSAE